VGELSSLGGYDRVGEKRARAAPTILVINDDQEILTLFEEILHEAGYSVLLYSSAIRDLAEIERLQPNLIIIDYLFGREESGWQLLQKIKMRRATAAIPIIVCTAATKLLLETSGYLLSKRVVAVPKPFDIDELLAAIERALALTESVPHPAGQTER
jgi:DNA-binding response OmpR family regulator